MFSEELAGYERVAVIDHDALRHNIRLIKGLVAPARVFAIIKADAYGHGAPEIARSALDVGAEKLGVAHVSEALSLREQGISAPLFAWLHTPATQFADAVSENIELGVSSHWELEAIAQAAQHQSKLATVHLKIDTGLGRNGATAQEWVTLCQRAAELEKDSGILRVHGIFSHLAVADERDRARETDVQRDAFNTAVAIATEAGLTIKERHLANSPAIFSRPDTHMDAVRAGVCIYGLSPFADTTAAELGLKPVMSLRTQVAQVKNVPSGQGISYGYRYTTQRESQLALIPVGYADGIPRVAENPPIDIKGTRFRASGRIAMDQLVVDLRADHQQQPPAPEISVGDAVEIFGARSGIEASEWADAAGTINYEIVTRIGQRVPRHHVNLTSTEPSRDVGGNVSPGQQLTLTLPTQSATEELAHHIASLVEAGDVLILTGDLGAGKTTFTQALARGLGITAAVTSPTFVIARQHESAEAGRPDLIHVDAYRLDTEDALASLDLEATQDTSVTVVEWGRGLAENLAATGNGGWLDIEFIRPVAGPQNPGQGQIVTDFSAEDLDEPRTVTLTAYGARFDHINLSPQDPR